MCELKVVINKNVVFENVVYATTAGNDVVKEIMEKSKEFKNHTITEVNITKEPLILSPTKHKTKTNAEEVSSKNLL